jgi:non-lysosomal glucosylceramidase
VTVPTESVEPSESTGPTAGVGPEAPRIPAVAWRRGIGVPCADVGHPRVDGPMIDDGEWAGVPIGGLGTGSIGRTFRGDFARWHLEVGTHAFRPSPVDGFTIHVGAADGEPARTTWLSALRPAGLPASIAALAPGQGTYHALFPRAWQAFEPADLGVRLVGEQLSPVIGGDLESSALPLGTYDWWIENPASEARTIGLLLTWEGPLTRDGAALPDSRHVTLAADDAIGVVLRSGPAAPTGLRGTFALAARNEPGLSIVTRTGLDAASLRAAQEAFARSGRLDAQPGRDGQTVAISVTALLSPGERRTVRFSIAWDFPTVEFGAGRRWWKRYTRTWGRTGERAWDLAEHALARTDDWRGAIDAWQAPILDDPGRPAWYRAALFNELYFLVDGGSFWEAGEVDGREPEPGDVGRFALLECIDYPFYDTVDVDFYASFAMFETFPELETRGIRDLLAVVPVDDPEIVTIEATGQTAIRKAPWTVPHDVGGPADDPFGRPNWYRYQDVNVWKDLGPKLVLQVWRDVVLTGDDALIGDALPVLDRVMADLAATDTDDDGLPDHGGIPDQTYDTWPMSGPSAYGGSLYLGALAALEAMHRRMSGTSEASGTARVDELAASRRRATESFERRLWRGTHYAYDDGNAISSDSVMADQLAGQWYADVTGLGDLVASDRTTTALRTVHELNVVAFGDGLLGAVNGMRKDGSIDESSEQSAEVWVGTTYALAAFMIGRGLVDEGWETARGAAAVTYERGLWFRTPEAYDRHGNFRASLYLRPLAIWAIEDALRRRRTA